MELLAPAGNIDALKIAVQCGADAVYLGGQAFNAREGAANFDNEQLREAFDYCHTHNVRAYVTLNTLLYDDELFEAYDNACSMSEMGADAFIVQDVGLLSLLKNNTNFELHASTQMSIHNLEGVEAAAQLGCKRVVLAREIPIDNIKRIKENSNTELEVFIHGALCVSFSGQCLFSSLAGGRSGNRGRCAQACRLPYSLYQKSHLISEGYLLSPKDLCTVKYISDICSTGVDSLKIEGRLKRPEYVGVVTEQYRNILDVLQNKGTYDESSIIKELASIFNRGGFTLGYYSGSNDIIYKKSPNNSGVKVGEALSRDGRIIFASQEINKGDGVDFRKNGQSVGGGAVFDIKVDGQKQDSFIGKGEINSLSKNALGAEIYRTTSKLQIDRINKYLTKEHQRIKLDLSFKQDPDNILLTVKDEWESVTVSKAYKFVHGNTAVSDITAALSKFGGTQYIPNELTVEHLGGYLPQGLINSLRREAKEALDYKKKEKFKHNKDYNKSPHLFTPEVTEEANKSHSIFVYDYMQLSEVCNCEKYKRVYFKPFDYNIDYSLPLNRKCDIYFVPFDIAFYDDMSLYSDIKKYDGIYAENIYSVMLAQKLNMKCVAGAGLNILNTQSALIYQKMGCHIITVSCEANAAQIKKIAAVCNAEIITRGRLPMMKFVCCPAQQQGACGMCDGNFTLKDRLGNRFQLNKFKLSECRNILLNCVNLDLDSEVQGMNVSDCDLNNSLDGAASTKGHYKRGV